jgi:hypothetical protein
MTIASGLLAQAGFAVETTVGTRVAPSRFVELNSSSLRLNIERIERQGLRAGRRLSYGWSPGTRMVEGQVNLDLSAESVGMLFRAAIGGVSTTGSGPYVHTFTPGNLPSLSVQIGTPATNGTVHPFDFLGCFVRGWELSASANEFATMQLDLMGKDGVTTNTTATASYSQSNFFTYVHGKLEIAGSEVCVDSVAVTGDNGLEGYHQICSTEAGKPKIKEVGQRSYGGTLQADFESLTAYNRYVNGTEAALTLTFEVSTSAKLVVTGNVRFDGSTPAVTGAEILKQELPFIFTSSTSASAAFTATLTNGDSAA